MTKLKINKGHFISFAILIGLAIVVAAVKPGKSDFQLSAEETLEQTVKRSHLVSVNRYKSLLASGTNPVMLIDLRSAGDYESGHLPDAISMPFEKLLDMQSVRLLKKEDVIKVIYSDSSFKAAQAWAILYQMGCTDLVILETTGSIEILVNDWSGADAPLIYNDEMKQFTFVPDRTITSELTLSQ
ncbi:MAG: rhodanese-like domain-containing protein [Bacteroidales bacterium]|nr:rhodanese-like domain-containing protein [Bacteroidales bacterium]